MNLLKKTCLSDCRTIVGSHRIALASGLRDSKIIEAQQGITKWAGPSTSALGGLPREVGLGLAARHPRNPHISMPLPRQELCPLQLALRCTELPRLAETGFCQVVTFGVKMLNGLCERCDIDHEWLEMHCSIYCFCMFLLPDKSCHNLCRPS